VGEVLIYLPGLAWLWAGFLHNLPAVLAAGLLPFLAGEAVKLALTTALLLAIGRRAA
jgi:biotin transporter BioY